jgi:hypothetical protein
LDRLSARQRSLEQLLAESDHDGFGVDDNVDNNDTSFHPMTVSPGNQMSTTPVSAATTPDGMDVSPPDLHFGTALQTYADVLTMAELDFLSSRQPQRQDPKRPTLRACDDAGQGTIGMYSAEQHDTSHGYAHNITSHDYAENDVGNTYSENDDDNDVSLQSLLHSFTCDD